MSAPPRCSDARPSRIRRAAAAVAARPVAALVALFVLALLPILPRVSTYFGDEHYYTDSVIRMIRTGDYVTPTTADGSLRFNKPIFTYWALAAGWRVLGVGLFGARIGSLLAGAALLWLTWRLGATLFGRTAGVLAALVLFSNNQVVSASMRSTPDVFLCLFVTLSLYGFARVIFSDRRTPASYLCAYIGAGLAVETKGLSGLLPVALAFGFCALRRDAPRPRDLLHAPAMLAGAAVALAWYAAVFARHGGEAIRGFLDDQVGANVGGERFSALQNALEYSVGIVRLFLPWALLAIGGLALAWQPVRAHVRQRSGPYAFALAWYLILFAIFTAGNSLRNRYFLPAYPLIAACMADLLCIPAVRERLARPAAVLLQAVAWVAGAAGLALIGLHVSVHPCLILAGDVLLVAAIAAGVAVRRDPRRALPALGVLCFVVIVSVHLFVRPAFPASPAAMVARYIELRGAPPAQLAVVGFRETSKVPAQLRVLTGGGIDVVAVPAPGDAPRAAWLLLSAPGVDTNRAALAIRYEIRECGYAWPRLRGKDIRRIVKAPDRAEAMWNLRERYYLAIPRDGAAGR